MKLSKKTARNFIQVWDNLSDTGPSDWEEFIELEGDQDVAVQKVYDFINQIRIFAYGVCDVEDCSFAREPDNNYCHLHEWKTKK